MAKDSNSSLKDGPFSDPVERQSIRGSTIKTEKMWPFISPFVAVSENLKAVAVVIGLIGLVTWITRPDIAGAVRILLGGGQ